MSHTVSFVVALILLVPGIFMAFVPMIPALSYMFLIALIFGIFDHFVALSLWELTGLLCITGLSIIVDHTAGLLGAKYGGAHSRSLLWGILCAILGIFFLPAFGSFIGLFVGIFISEMYYKNHHAKALKAAGSALIGSVVGVGINIILSIIFLTFFVIFAIS